MATNKIGQVGTYKKIEIDNAICNRRFHISFEEGSPVIEKHVNVDCPHCGVTLFEADNHPPVILARDENLVKQVDGSRPTLYECRFVAK